MDNVKWIETARANPIRRAVEGGGWEEVGDWRSGEERRNVVEQRDKYGAIWNGSVWRDDLVCRSGRERRGAK